MKLKDRNVFDVELLDGKDSTAFAPASHSHNYLSTSGGTISSPNFGMLTLDRSGSTNAPTMIFKNANGILGFVGMSGSVNGNLQRWSADSNSVFNILDSGNYKTIVTPANIGAAAASHGTHVSYGGNGSATTVSRSDHTHASVRGAASDNVVVTADTGIMRYDFNIVNSSTGNMPSVNNANGLLTFNTHPGNYYSQLGFSSNGNLYYRSFNNKAIDSTTAWRQISFSDHTHSGYAPASHTHSTLSSLDISNNLKVFGTSITNGLATFGGGANFGKTKIFFNTTELKDGGPWYGLGNIDLSMGGPTGTPLQLAGYYGLRLRSDTTVIDLEQSNQGPQIYTSYGSVRIGPLNTSYCHFSTDRPRFHFNKHIALADGQYLSTSNNYGITGRRTDGTDAYMLLMGTDNKINLGWGGLGIKVNGTMTIPDVYNDGWYRSRGNVGWFSETYGGGIYMIDSSYVRTYNNKHFHCNKTLDAGNDFNQNAASQNYAGGYQLVRGDLRSRIMYDDGMSIDTYAANGGYHGGTVFKERSIIPRWAGHSGGEGHSPYLGYSSYRWTGAYITNGVTTGSDSKLKENIQPILRNGNVRNRAFSNEPAEDITSQDLYDYVKNTGIYRFNYKVTPNKRTVGVIADEIPDNIFNAIGEVSCNEEEYQNKLKQKEDKLKLLETYEVATPLLDKDMNELLSIASSTDDPLCQEIHDAIKEAVETFQESRARIYKEDSSNNRSIYDLEWSNELTTFVNMYVLNNGRKSYKSTDIKDVLCDALINANTREVNDILDFTLIGDTNLTYKELKAAENETVEEPVRLINSSAQIAMLQEVLSMALNKIEFLEKEIDKLKGVI